MEELVKDTFSLLMLKNRERFNALWAAASVSGARLDSGLFMRMLREELAGLVNAVAEHSPDKAEEACASLYELALELFRRNLLGPKAVYPRVNELWQGLLPDIAAHVAEAPKYVAAALTNAVYNLCQDSDGIAGTWLSVMRGVSAYCRDFSDIMQAGIVAAWRLGAAYAREAALKAIPRVPADAALAALGIIHLDPRPTIENVLREMHDPWFRPDLTGREIRRKLSIIYKIGGFRGFGGKFITPPEITLAGDTIYAFDSEFCHALHADCFGATLRRFGDNLPEATRDEPVGYSMDKDGRITRGEYQARLPGTILPFSSYAANGSFLAFSRPDSHFVYIVALKPEAF